MSLLIALALTGCGIPTDAITLDDCNTSISGDVPTFFQDYFACVEIDDDGGDVVLWTDGLPPHASAYYATDHENYVAFDDRGGTHFQNPNTIGEQSFEITFPADPIAKGITIDASLVDNTMNTSDEEYGGGGQGVTLNGVIAFAAMAAPGDNLADEQYTFDLYEGHPAGDTYHYHFNTPGPLEVLEAGGFVTTSTPGEAEIELYGVMCDGTVILGCTELDGSTPDDSDFDAQNGHIHDIGSDFTGRYHTHVCPSLWPDYPYFPEIAYYEDDGC